MPAPVRGSVWLGARRRRVRLRRSGRLLALQLAGVRRLGNGGDARAGHRWGGTHPGLLLPRRPRRLVVAAGRRRRRRRRLGRDDRPPGRRCAPALGRRLGCRRRGRRRPRQSRERPGLPDRIARLLAPTGDGPERTPRLQEALAAHGLARGGRHDGRQRDRALRGTEPAVGPQLRVTAVDGHALHHPVGPLSGHGRRRPLQRHRQPVSGHHAAAGHGIGGLLEITDGSLPVDVGADVVKGRLAGQGGAGETDRQPDPDRRRPPSATAHSATLTQTYGVVTVEDGG